MTSLMKNMDSFVATMWDGSSKCLWHCPVDLLRNVFFILKFLSEFNMQVSLQNDKIESKQINK